MKKPVWLCVVLCFLWSGCQTTGLGTGGKGQGPQGSAPITLPALQTYPSGVPLPVGSFTHLVMGRCGEDGRFMAEAVNAPGRTIVARWVGYSDAAASRFLAEAWGAGVPVTVYTARVVVKGAPPSPTGSPEGVLYEPCHIPRAADVPPEGEEPTPNAGDPRDELPSDPGPQGGKPLWQWFSWLALDTAQAIDTVSSRAP
jgi:hypothetical protein